MRRLRVGNGHVHWLLWMALGKGQMGRALPHSAGVVGALLRGVLDRAYKRTSVSAARSCICNIWPQSACYAPASPGRIRCAAPLRPELLGVTGFSAWDRADVHVQGTSARAPSQANLNILRFHTPGSLMRSSILIF